MHGTKTPPRLRPPALKWELCPTTPPYFPEVGAWGFPALSPRPEAPTVLGLLARSTADLPKSSPTAGKPAGKTAGPSLLAHPPQASRCRGNLDSWSNYTEPVPWVISAPGPVPGLCLSGPGGRVSHQPAPTASPALRVLPRCPLQAGPGAPLPLPPWETVPLTQGQLRP